MNIQINEIDLASDAMNRSQAQPSSADTKSHSEDELPIRRFPGFSLGMRQAAVVCQLDFNNPQAEAAIDVANALRTSFGEAAEPASGEALQYLVACCGQYAVVLQTRAGLPVFETPRLVDLRTAQEPAAYRLFVPYWRHEAAVFALRGVVTAARTLLKAWRTPGWAATCSAVRAATEQLQRQIAASAPRDSNVTRLLQAAYSLGIPAMPAAGNIVRYGQGARSRWLNSSLTDTTSSLGVSLAHNKALAARIMREAGLPVPAHRRAGSAKGAVAIAERLGYPVVVKPADCEQGSGVSTDLGDAQAVSRAYERATAFSETVLVEQHIPGQDYRLLVFQGRLFWAVHRIPGGVTGDGMLSVRQLLEVLNRDPHRGSGPQFPLKTLHFDDEAAELLDKQKLSIDQIPASGQFVRLRHTANVALGGVPVSVIDKVHPDNRRLAERAADALRLDLAGIDLLIPDIAESWLKTGAGICEINAQPSLGSVTAGHLYGDLLRILLDGDGRIPITVVLGARQGQRVAQGVREARLKSQPNPGLLDRSGIWVGEHQVALRRSSFYEDGLVLLSDPQVHSAILLIEDLQVLADGLPFDRFDELILADSDLGSSRQAGRGIPTLLRKLLLPACSGRVVYNRDDAECRSWAQAAAEYKLAIVGETLTDDRLANLATQLEPQGKALSDRLQTAPHRPGAPGQSQAEQDQ